MVAVCIGGFGVGGVSLSSIAPQMRNPHMGSKTGPVGGDFGWWGVAFIVLSDIGGSAPYAVSTDSDAEVPSDAPPWRSNKHQALTAGASCRRGIWATRMELREVAVAGERSV